MEDATRDLLGLWDVVDRTVAELGPDDWARPLPVAGAGFTDVAELAVHLAGVHYAATEQVPAALDAARRRAALRLAGRPAGDPVLGAQCLDMCLHVHDLTAAVGRPADLRDHDAAAREACRLVLRVLPRLLVSVVGADDASLSVVVRTGEGRAVRVEHGHVVPTGAVGSGRVGHAIDGEIETEAAALLLLLAGRRGADTLHDEGVLDWSGPVADAVVRRAGLLAQRPPVAAANAG